MRIEEFYYYVEIYKYGSINAAAKSNYISQAALSNILKNIEKELGIQLFIRNNHGIEATEYGRRFYEYACKITRTWQNILNMKDDIIHDNNLSIIYAPSSFIAQCLFSFQKKYPCEVGNDVFEEDIIINNFAVLQELKARMVIALFDTKDIEPFRQKCQKYHLKLNVLQDGLPVFLLTSKKHSLAGRRSVAMEEAFSYPLVKYKSLSGKDESGGDNETTLYINNRGLYTEAIQTGKYVSTTFYMSPEVLAENNLICIPIEGQEHRIAVSTIIRDDYQLGKREKKFLNYFSCQLNQYYRSLEPVKCEEEK